MPIWINKSLSVNQQRLEGYRQALKDYGLTAYKELQILLDISSSNYDGARCATEKLIQSGIPFDGVFATNDWRAYGVVVALTENHIRVPEDVKVIGFDDIPISYACHPSLSTIHQNTKLLAQKASSLLLSLMNGESPVHDEKHYILPVELVQRDSTQI